MKAAQRERRSQRKRLNAGLGHLDTDRFTDHGSAHRMAMHAAPSKAATKVPMAQRILNGGYNHVTYANTRPKPITPWTRTK